MAYTTIKKPSSYFRTKLYQGNSTDNTTITWDETDTNFGSNLFLWLKTREYAVDPAQEHWLTDSVRGATKFLETNSANAEIDAGGNYAYTTNGFVVDNAARTNRGSMVAWSWNTSSSASSNTDGSITSTVSANTTSGFSIVSYTGNGTAGATVGHGLGTAPSMIIQKARNSVLNWKVYHKSLGATQYMNFDETNAVASNIVVWNNTEPTSSVYSLGSGNTNTSSVNYIAYCFAEKQGFSKFGSYVGNGSTDGTFVYTGFKPAFVMIKNTSAIGTWMLKDVKRDPFNVANTALGANNPAPEVDYNTTLNEIDILSNGFKLRDTYSDQNTSGNSYIYMAFAEEPLVGDNPATAR